MTDWLTRLEKVFQGRTKGIWEADRDCDVHNLSVLEWEPIFDADMPIFIASTHFQEEGGNSKFIALSGTIADEVFAVLKAAESWHAAAERACYPTGYDQGVNLMDECMDAGAACGEALAALKAKVDSLNGL